MENASATTMAVSNLGQRLRPGACRNASPTAAIRQIPSKATITVSVTTNVSSKKLSPNEARP